MAMAATDRLQRMDLNLPIHLKPNSYQTKPERTPSYYKNFLDQRPCLSLLSSFENLKMSKLNISPRYILYPQETQDRLLIGGGSVATVVKKNSYTLLTPEQLVTLKKYNRDLKELASIGNKNKTQHILNMKKALLTKKYVRKVFPLTKKNFLEATRYETAKNIPPNSIIQNIIDHEVKVSGFGIVINLDVVKTRTPQKDLEITRILGKVDLEVDIELLKEDICIVYPDLSESDFEIFYDMQYCDSQTVGAQLLDRYFKRNFYFFENLIDKVKHVVSTRLENSQEIQDPKKSYESFFGNKFEFRVCDEHLNFLENVYSEFFSRELQIQYEPICSKLSSLMLDCRLFLNSYLDMHSEILLPRIEALEIHSDMTLGNLMGDLTKGQLIYIDNNASFCDKKPIITELFKFLFGFGHQGNLSDDYEVNKGILTQKSILIANEMLALKENALAIFNQDLTLKQVSSEIFLQADFFSIMQHISDAGYVICEHIKCAVSQKRAYMSFNKVNQIEFDNKLKKLLDRCLINSYLYERQIPNFIKKLSRYTN